MQGGGRSRRRSWGIASVVLLTALTACATTTDTPPSARELVGTLVDAKVCTHPSETTPDRRSQSWSCVLPGRASRDRRYVSIHAYPSSEDLRRSVARWHPRCPSDVVLVFVQGPAWIALVVPRTHHNLVAVRRTLGGDDLVLRCRHRTAATPAPVPGGADTSSTTASTSTTTTGPRPESPATRYVPPVHVPPPPAMPRIDEPPPTPAMTAPPGWHPPPTEPPGTIHASSRDRDLRSGVGRRDAAPGAAGAPPEGGT